jgi:hypothetical protein
MLAPESEGRSMSSVGFVGRVKDVEALKAFVKEIGGARKEDGGRLPGG